jgi:hypothetical protein
MNALSVCSTTGVRPGVVRAPSRFTCRLVSNLRKEGMHSAPALFNLLLHMVFIDRGVFGLLAFAVVREC